MNIVGKFQRFHVNEKIVQFNKKFLSSFFIILICFLLDRFSKIYVLKLFMENEFRDHYVNSFLNLSLVWNSGIAFGLLKSESLFYHLISFFILLIIIFICYLIFKAKQFSEVTLFSMIVGGAIGNVFDRFYYNAVPDFIDLHYGNFHWFTFNVSDICISIGIFLLIIFDIFKFDKKEKKDE